MEHTPSWEAYSHSASQVISCLYGTRRFIIVFTGTATGPYPEPDSSTPHLPTIFSLRSILISSFHLRLVLLSVLFLSCFRPKFCIHLSSLHAYYMHHPSHYPWFHDPNNIWWSLQDMKLLIMQSSPASRHFLPLRCKYSPQHPFALRTISSRRMRNLRKKQT